MILTPKNWKSFQHYKERTPSWIKLHKGLMTDFEFVRLPVASRALAPMLWLLASEYEGGEIDASLEKIAFRVHMTVVELQDALNPLIDSGFFDASDTLAKSEQPACLEKRDIGKRKEENKPTPSAPSPSDDFEKFKQAYPRRDGANPWQPAEKKFKALVKTGVNPEVIIAGAEALAREEGPRGNIGTKFIPQAITWLNQQRFHDYAAASFSSSSESAAIDWDSVLSFYQKTRVWTKGAGPDPDSLACRAPRELLEKYGIRSSLETIQ